MTERVGRLREISLYEEMGTPSTERSHHQTQVGALKTSDGVGAMGGELQR